MVGKHIRSMSPEPTELPETREQLEYCNGCEYMIGEIHKCTVDQNTRRGFRKWLGPLLYCCKKRSLTRIYTVCHSA